MTANLVWSIALAAIGILGIYLAGRKNLWGWAVGFGAQVLWLIFGLVTGQYGFILSAVAYGVVYGRNWLRWRRESKPDSAQAATDMATIRAHLARGTAPHKGRVFWGGLEWAISRTLNIPPIRESQKEQS